MQAWAKIRNSTAIAGLSVRPWMVEPEYTAMDGSYSELLKNTPPGTVVTASLYFPRPDGPPSGRGEFTIESSVYSLCIQALHPFPKAHREV